MEEICFRTREPASLCHDHFTETQLSRKNKASHGFEASWWDGIVENEF